MKDRNLNYKQVLLYDIGNFGTIFQEKTQSLAVDYYDIKKLLLCTSFNINFFILNHF